jgi:hypothetical protein
VCLVKIKRKPKGAPDETATAEAAEAPESDVR